MWTVLQGKLNIYTLPVLLKYGINVLETDDKGHSILHYLLSSFERIRKYQALWQKC